MKTFIYLVVSDDEIVFASLSKEVSEAYADTYNSDEFNTDTAVVATVEVPVAMLRSIPRLIQKFSSYEPSMLTPVFKSAREDELLLDGDMISIKGLDSVVYVNDEYVYLEDEDMWYLIDGEELVLPDYSVEEEIEAYVDVMWMNPRFNCLVVFVVNDTEFTRLDVVTACDDFIDSGVDIANECNL